MPRAAKLRRPKQSFEVFEFPTKGMDLSHPYGDQPPGTTPVAVNVMAYEPTTDRARGGSRPMLTKILSALNGTNPMQEVCMVLDASISPIPGSMGLLPGGGLSRNRNQANRSIILLGIAGGVMKAAYQGVWNSVVNTTTNFDPNVRRIGSTTNGGAIFFVDSQSYKVYNPSNNTLALWGASAGSMPLDSGTNHARLIETWRGRILLAGFPLDPGNLYGSKVNDGTNWDTAPASPSSIDSWVAGASDMGKLPGMLTCIYAYNDDVCVLGSDHEIHLLNGDPGDGGRADLVTDAIGMAWGKPICRDPQGTLYFMSNRTGIYAFTPGSRPMRMSQQIDSLLTPLNMDDVQVRLFWDDGIQGVRVYITSTSGPTPSDTHYVWEKRSGGWHEEPFGNANHNPLCGVVYDGNDPTDRAMYIGGWDGCVRGYSASAASDDGTPVASEVWLGPIKSRELDPMVLKNVLANMGENSGTVTWEVHLGKTAEAALSSPAVRTGTFGAGFNYTFPVRMRAHAIWLRLTSTVPWQMEAIRGEIEEKGKVGKRSPW